MRRGIAEPRDEPRREERREGGAAHSGAEHPGGEPTPVGLVPGADERHADRERRPGDAQEESEDEHEAERPGVARHGHEENERDGREDEDRHHHLPTEAVGQGPGDDPAERPDEHGGGHQESLLVAVEPHLLRVPHGEWGDHVPGPEGQGEGTCGDDEVLGLAT
jgi:hypothetical protein